MEWSVLFFINSIFLGVGLAMDAFSVSVVNGMNKPCMSGEKVIRIASVFAFFQALMPMLGWMFSHTMLHFFGRLQRFIPWISMGMLLFVGISMIRESRKEQEEEVCPEVCPDELLDRRLLAQGIATSIDALSVGFAMAEYSAFMAVVCSGIIAAVTFAVCITGVMIGKKAGLRLSGKAEIFGGTVLIAIGLENVMKII